MSNRYDLIGYCSYRDNETGKISDNFVGVLNEQDQKIKDLEHRLSNCIEPKFKIGQEVWFIDPEKDVSKGEIWNIELISNQILYSVFWGDECEDVYYQYELFATEEEAKARLEEVKNG